MLSPHCCTTGKLDLLLRALLLPVQWRPHPGGHPGRRQHDGCEDCCACCVPAMPAVLDPAAAPLVRISSYLVIVEPLLLGFVDAGGTAGAALTTGALAATPARTLATSLPPTPASPGQLLRHCAGHHQRARQHAARRGVVASRQRNQGAGAGEGAACCIKLTVPWGHRSVALLLPEGWALHRAVSLLTRHDGRPSCRSLRSAWCTGATPALRWTTGRLRCPLWAAWPLWPRAMHAAGAGRPSRHGAPVAKRFAHAIAAAATTYPV